MDNPIRVRSVAIDGAAWYAVSDVAKAAGHRDASSFLGCALPGQYRKHPVPTNGGRQSMYVISTPGLEYVLSRVRSRKARRVSEALGLAVVWSAPIEVETLSFVEAAFAHLPLSRQHRVGPYRVDLYLPSLKIAVECDENSHTRKVKRLADEARQRFIEEQTGCQFVRYNPQVAGFNPGGVVNQILMLALPVG